MLELRLTQHPAKRGRHKVEIALEGDGARRTAESTFAFALSGISKICGLPQLKLGWCAVAGPRDEALRAMERLELIADTYLSVATPVQLAAGDLLETRHGFQRQVMQRVQANRRALTRARPADARWDVLPSEGGWSAIVSVPRTRSEDEWALALLSAGVLVHPGYFFDFPAGGHLVLSLVAPEGDFASLEQSRSQSI